MNLVFEKNRIKKILYLIILIGNMVTSCQYEKSSSSIKGKDSPTKDNLNSFIKHVDGFDYTKLGISCKNNDFLEVKRLISKGADITLAKKDEMYAYDALSVAIENKHLQVVQYLIAHRADVNIVYNEDGLTPLGLATKLNAEEIVEILVKNGADVNGSDVFNADYKETPLVIAINGNHFAIAKLLILSGANIHATDNKGTSIKNLILSKGDVWEKLLLDVPAH